jgi:hypothetical protein
LYSSYSIVGVIKLRTKCMGSMRNTYKILVEYPEGKRSLGRHRHRWEVKVKLSLCLTKHHTMKAYWGVEA